MRSSQNWTIFRGHFYAFQGLFLRWGYFLGSLKFQIFLDWLKILIFFVFLGGEGGER